MAHGVGLLALLPLAVLAFLYLTLVAPPGAKTTGRGGFNFGGGGFQGGFNPGGGDAMVEQAAPAGKARLRVPAQGVVAPPKAVDDDARGDKGGAEPPRVRQFFPETLLWKPELITDDQGRLAPITIQLADSITTWRLAASAVSADGRLGAAQMPMKVFQPFFVDLNLPVALTRGDEVAVPVVVYNYLDKAQTVSLTLREEGWFTNQGQAKQELKLGPGEVRSLRFPIKVEKVGRHTVEVTALAGGVSDAIRREIDVEPDGRRVEKAFNGSLTEPATVVLDVPQGAIEGSVKAYVKLYPSSFSQLVEGLENIFQMPSGCFEQTSSTTYPNVLALDYLTRTKQDVPKVKTRAKQFIHLGYQRLLGFEVQGGGFDWYGRPPANQTLTAYGLQEFEDMAKVHDVDPNLIQRTRQWLLNKRKSDGSWEPEGRQMYGVLGNDPRMLRLSLTAYIAWAVFGGDKASAQAQTTLDYLLSHRPSAITDPHTLALVCNALLAIDPRGKEAGPYLDRLVTLKKTDEGGKLAHWAQAEGARTTFYGAGLGGQVETTALSALALIRSGEHPAAARAALNWLVSKKDPRGTWYSTQATVLALKALLAGTGKPLGGDGARQLELRIGQHAEKLSIPADQAEVMKQIDLTPHLAAGANRLTLAETTTTGMGYQVTFRYHVAEAKVEKKKEPLSIQISYDRQKLQLGEVVTATATVSNHTGKPAPMVMLDLPVPGGFAVGADSLQKLVKAGTIGRYQVRPRQVLVYLRNLQPEKPLELTYQLRPTMPVNTLTPPARVYEYYDPQKQGRQPGVRFQVTP
jgi:uncharacterized protein YfaS (alpha-2-macroglobulin family)